MTKSYFKKALDEPRKKNYNNIIMNIYPKGD